MHFRIGHPVDFLGNELPMSTENPAGYIVQAKIIKQKSAPNDRKSSSYYLMCDRGIVPMFDYAKLAIGQYGIIKKGGAWFTFCDPYTGEVLMSDGKPVKINGQAKVYQYLEDHQDYYKKLCKYIESDIYGIDLDDEEAGAPVDSDMYEV